jgi:peptide/nickel transport system substrate-binding protein
MCPIMPERLAATDPYKPIPEVIGSGPFRFKADEQVAGSRHVYERFDRYKPRDHGYADFLSGPKVAHFDRVEWQIIPDGASALEALLLGEVDWVEYPLEDALATLKHDSRVTVRTIGSAGWWGMMRPNHLHPPFDNPAVRRALWGAIAQSDFMTAAIGTDSSLWRVPTGFFPPDTPMASDVGLHLLTGPRDLDRARSDIRAAGYSGEKVTVILPDGLWRAKIFGEIAGDLLGKVGMNVDQQVMDTATWARQLVNMKPASEGGWSVFCTSMQGTDALSPACHAALRGTGVKAYAGWPDCPDLEALRGQWLDAADIAAQRAVAGRLQGQAFLDAPYYPLGTFYPSTAYRSDLDGVLDGQAIFWNVKRNA